MLSLNSVTNVFFYFKQSSDDWVDRAHYIFTMGALIFFATLVASGQTFGRPIQCMIGAHYPSEWTVYVNSYCYVTGTFVTDNFGYGEMPDRKLKDDERTDVSYYQWIPYVLIIQAVFFLIPHFFWVVTQMLSDVDFSFFVERCANARDQKNYDDTKKALAHVASDISKLLKYRSVKGCRTDGLGNLGVCLYCLSKLLNVVNIILQLYFLSYFIGHGHQNWGFQLLKNLLTINEPIPFYRNVSHTDVFFPRVTFCYFRHNKLANVNDGTVQCLLMLNMLNEKLFAMLFAWFHILLAITIVNLVYTLMNVVSSVGIYRSRAYLQIHNVSKYTSMKFINEVLGLDGLLLLHFVKKCSGFSTASDLAYLLYEQQFAQEASDKTHAKGNSDTSSRATIHDYSEEIHLMKKSPYSSNA